MTSFLIFCFVRTLEFFLNYYSFIIPCMYRIYFNHIHPPLSLFLSPPSVEPSLFSNRFASYIPVFVVIVTVNLLSLLVQLA